VSSRHPSSRMGWPRPGSSSQVREMEPQPYLREVPSEVAKLFDFGPPSAPATEPCHRLAVEYNFEPLVG
jgi:hypothetical protein